MATKKPLGSKIGRHPHSEPRANAGPERLDLLETVRLLHDRITASLCKAVFGRVRRTERQRKWSLHALMRFWIEVILRAPESLSRILQEVSNAAWRVAASPEAFFQRCQSLRPEFFAALFDEFVGGLQGDAPETYAREVQPLRKRFERIWIVDGSRLDKILHRLKILWDDRRAVLPGCLLVFYDLFRGIPTLFQFDADAAAPEGPRADAALGLVPQGTLLLGDRLFSGPRFFQSLQDRGLWGVLRYNKHVLIKTLRRLSRRKVGKLAVEDWEVQAGGGSTAPVQNLRWIVRRGEGKTFSVLTNVLDPKRLSADEALTLYRHRWAIERLFYDLKTVLNLNRFYGANPNAVAMQVYACATVYVAMRVAQARLAISRERDPDEVSPEKLFPRIAAASHGLLVFEETVEAFVRANPKIALKRPNPEDQKWASTSWQQIAVEKRSPHRRRRIGTRQRKHWQSFAHIRGGGRFLT